MQHKITTTRTSIHEKPSIKPNMIAAYVSD